MELAGDLDAHVVSSDSLQVYKYLDIGTAKPSPEERQHVPHHLIDILNPDEEFNAGSFRQLASRTIDAVHGSGKRVILAGGTYLYAKALLSGIIEGLPADRAIRADLKKQRSERGTAYLYERLTSIDPETASKVHSNDYVRIERALEVWELTGQKMSLLQSLHEFGVRDYEYLKIGISVERSRLRDRIDRRVDDMLARGLVDEVMGLREMGYGPEIKPMQSIGYKEINSYLDGALGFDEAVELIKRDTKRFAKRQMTWLRADNEINWFELPGDYQKIVETAGIFLTT